MANRTFPLFSSSINLMTLADLMAEQCVGRLQSAKYFVSTKSGEVEIGLNFVTDEATIQGNALPFLDEGRKGDEVASTLTAALVDAHSEQLMKQKNYILCPPNNDFLTDLGALPYFFVQIPR